MDFEIRTIISILFLFVALKASTTQKLTVRSRIIKGRSAIEGQFPFYVLIKREPKELIYGAGSLISSDWVLTTAHVVIKLKSVILVFGLTNLTETNNLSMTSRNMYIHSGYTPSTMTNDIALIKLPKSVTFNDNIEAIALPTFSMAQSEMIGLEVTVMGFGYTSDSPFRKAPNELQYTEMNLMSNDECSEKFQRKIDRVIVCSKSSADSTTCNGDSGGPAVIEDDDGNYIQVGIVSFGFSQRCESHATNALTRITSFLQWIHDATGLIQM